MSVCSRIGDHCRVKRCTRTNVIHSGRNARSSECIKCLLRSAHHLANRENRYRTVTGCQLECIQPGANKRRVNRTCSTLWITNDDRSIVGKCHRIMQHLLQIFHRAWSQHAHARNLRQQRHVVDAVVARAVVASHACTVEAEDHWQAMQCNVVDHLVPRTGQERGIQRNNGAKSAHRHACCCGDCMLFGNAHIEEAIRELRLEIKKTSGARHRSGDRNNSWVGFCFCNKGLAECIRITGDRCLLWTIERIKRWRVMQVLFIVIFCE
ncbi:unannotated protein [freshwater metagenome]|uniref:Unannotated protein n=1 Tax=freshwater metagenome TaxID=449393 RepID=A0A6J6NT32_9ZZZZ